RARGRRHPEPALRAPPEGRRFPVEPDAPRRAGASRGSGQRPPPAPGSEAAGNAVRGAGLVRPAPRRATGPGLAAPQPPDRRLRPSDPDHLALVEWAGSDLDRREQEPAPPWLPLRHEPLLPVPPVPVPAR